jgi:hypothetical protein
MNYGEVDSPHHEKVSMVLEACLAHGPCLSHSPTGFWVAGLMGVHTGRGRHQDALFKHSRGPHHSLPKANMSFANLFCFIYLLTYLYLFLCFYF